MADPARVLYLGARGGAVAAELRRGGHQPSMQYAGGEVDLAAALGGNSDILICESLYGECGALHVLRAVRERGLDLPVIVVSGEIEDSEIAAALEAGAADHLTEGNLTRLNAAVTRELRAARTRRERVNLERQLHRARETGAVGRLAAGVAHDINNLLTIVTGYSDLLLGQRGMDAAQRTALEAIRRAAEQGGSRSYELLSLCLQPSNSGGRPPAKPARRRRGGAAKS